MKHFSPSSVQLVPMTTELIGKFSSMTPVSMERRINPSRVKILQNTCSEVRTEFNWTEVHCLETNKTYRGNGNHSSYMLNNKIIEKHKNDMVLIKKYEVDTVSDVALLWSQFDPNISSRSKEEVLKCALGIYEDLTGVRQRVIRGVCNAVCIAKYGNNYSSTTPLSDQAAEVRLETDFVRFADDVLDTAQAPWTNTGVVYAMYLTWLENSTLAKLFWSGVLEPDETVSVLSPEIKLREILIKGIPPNNGLGSIQWYDFTHFCLQAWKGKKLGLVYGGKKRLAPRHRKDGMAGLDKYFDTSGGRIKGLCDGTIFDYHKRNNILENRYPTSFS
jgi:hypothetical protein